jgi:coronin-1B/1C/6
LNEFRGSKTGKAFGFLKKNTVDVRRCELQKALKISENHLEFISFIQPRKVDSFQEDLYPDCPSKTPNQTSQNWLSNHTQEPLL